MSEAKIFPDQGGHGPALGLHETDLDPDPFKQFRV